MFTDLTDVISKSGQVSNAGLVLTDRIDKVSSRVTTLNMQQIEEDLKQVREENAKLIALLKEMKSKDGKSSSKEKSKETTKS